jgi:hypothetical protein
VDPVLRVNGVFWSSSLRYFLGMIVEVVLACYSKSSGDAFMCCLTMTSVVPDSRLSTESKFTSRGKSRDYVVSMNMTWRVRTSYIRFTKFLRRRYCRQHRVCSGPSSIDPIGHLEGKRGTVYCTLMASGAANDALFHSFQF